MHSGRVNIWYGKCPSGKCISGKSTREACRESVRCGSVNEGSALKKVSVGEQSSRIMSHNHFIQPMDFFHKFPNYAFLECVNPFVPQRFVCFSFTGINFRGILHRASDVSRDENRCELIRTRKCRVTN